MRILCSGDLHLGRRPTRLPAHVDARRLSASAIWDGLVRSALERRVDLVALSGDLVDRDNRFFEAFGPLERGMHALAEARIPVVAVAGNHDHDVLPRLAASLGPERFRLLGAGGRWERVTLLRAGVPALHVDGWSFPAEHVAGSPLAAYPFAGSSSAPVLGLLHADLDRSGSRYAPVTLGELRERAVSAWVLGHVHGTVLHEPSPGVPLVVYPGSPQGMDPGEPGWHGAWLMELRPGAPAGISPVPLARVRYERVEVSVERASTARELEERVAESVRLAVSGWATEGDPLEILSCRVVLTGSSPLGRRVAEEVAERCRDLEVPAGRVTACVETVEVRTRPAVDLPALARGGGLPAAIARLLLDLDDATAPCALAGEAEARLAELFEARPYRPLRSLPGDVPAPSAARTLLREQGEQLLGALLAQKEGR